MIVGEENIAGGKKRNRGIGREEKESRRANFEYSVVIEA